MKQTALFWILVSGIVQLSCKNSNPSSALNPMEYDINSEAATLSVSQGVPMDRENQSKTLGKDQASKEEQEPKEILTGLPQDQVLEAKDSLMQALPTGVATSDGSNQPSEKSETNSSSAGITVKSSEEILGAKTPEQLTLETEKLNSKTIPSQDQVQQPEASKETASPTDLKQSETKPNRAVYSAEDCRPLKISGMPQWFEDEKVFLTRVAKPCITQSGEAGSESASQWVTMGISCSGGENRFRWLENYLDPKQVNIDFGISCPMSLNWGDVSQALSGKTGLIGSKMIAYNPMAVVYWELEETGEKDVGSLIKIKNVKELKPYWREFIMKGKPLSLKLVGYESAWTEVRQYFQISAQIVKASKNTFKLNIKDAKPLGSQELAMYQNQCEKLVPRRDCERVF